MPPAQISLTLSRHFSLSFIASGRSSRLHPESSQSYCMYVRAGRPAFARPYVGVHRSTSLMSSSLLLQQSCIRLTWIVFVMGGMWPYSWCFKQGQLIILFDFSSDFHAFKSLSQNFGSVPSVPTTIDITVTHLFHSFLLLL